MARYVVLEDFDSRDTDLLAGTIVNDDSMTLGPLINAGLSLAPIVYPEDENVIAEFNSARGSRTHTGDDYGNMLTLWMTQAKSAASMIKTGSGATLQDALTAGSGGVAETVQVIAGNGLIGGGALGGDVTLDIGATDASIVVGASGIGVALASATPSAIVASVGSAGSASNVARADHVHVYVPPILQTGFSNISVNTTTTSTSFVDLLTVTLTTGANAILIETAASASNDTLASNVQFQVLVDATPVAGFASYLAVIGLAGSAGTTLKRSVTAGSHTVKVQWKVSAGTGQIRPTTTILEQASLLVTEITV